MSKITQEALRAAGWHEIHWNAQCNGGFYEYLLNAEARSTISVSFGEYLPEYLQVVWIKTQGSRIALLHVNTLDDLATLCQFMTGEKHEFNQQRS
jgi:hypothetical protein